MCKFMKESGDCHLSKKQCTVDPTKIEKCNYYIRQHPQDQKIYIGKFNKALSKALSKRDISNQYEVLKSLYKIDFSLSIYENIQKCILAIKPFEITVKTRRNLKEDELFSNVLHSLTSNLYNESRIQILQQNIEKNELIIMDNMNKYLVKVKSPLSTFFKEISCSKNPTKYYKEQALSIKKI